MKNEIARLQQLAEIKVNNPIKFRKIPFSVVKSELLRNELEWKTEVHQQEGDEEMSQEDIYQTETEILSINDYYDLLGYYEGEGFNRAEAMEQIFLLLVNKDE